MPITDQQKQLHIQRRGYTLKYLFEAEYEDGTFFKQTQDDMSEQIPCERCVLGKESDICVGKSQHYDMRTQGKAVKKFSIISDLNKITVDLESGIFIINGMRALLESVKLPTLPEQFELVYYRQHTHDTLATYSTKTGEMTKPPEEMTHFVEYFVGWKCNIAGKEYIQKIGVA